MTDAFEIRRVSPAYPPKSGCGVPPQSVRAAFRSHSSSSFQRFSFQRFSFYPMFSALIRQRLPQPERLVTLNDIAITQMRTLLAAGNVKQLQ